MRWEIDARTVEGVNQEEFARWIEDYGIDSDVVKVRVLGQAPSASELQFIDAEHRGRSPLASEIRRFKQIKEIKPSNVCREVERGREPAASR